MTHDKSGSKPPQAPEDSGGAEDKITQNDKNGDWIAELERELQELEKKWPGSGRFR